MFYLLVLLLVLYTQQSWAESPGCADQDAAKVESLQGKLSVDPEGKGQWRQIRQDEKLCEGARARVEASSRASLRLPNGIVLRLDENTVVSLSGIGPKQTTMLDLLEGFIHFISRTPTRLEITSPIANAGPEGTEFAMQVKGGTAKLWVYEGGVRFFNAAGSLRLNPGQGAQAEAGQAPRAELTIKPEDAVNWALYYPPLLPYPAAGMAADDYINQAIKLYRQGRVDEALIQLEAQPESQRTAYYHKVRGAIRLSAGRAELAMQDIQAVQEQQPNDAEANALKAVLALVQNRKAEAYALAEKAVAANPRSAAAHSALSYVEQSRFDLDKAQAAANQAVQLAPHDAMVWARKAELELAQGQQSASKTSAKQALDLDANIERTQTVIGFAYLLDMDTKAALAAFTKAAQLDSTAPLPRLGMGLAKIRQGDLAAGREDLEIAAILDPANSLTRSYLGKAYYEENRNALAEDQFKLAKERDPKDPTPYFYDALKKQTENRPVEALQDLHKSTELNDNRAVYRSKQLLDADRAARGASLARIYDTLGFGQRGILEASKSIALDPSNYSAHRFLSDSYVRFPARGVAQTSELLQAQMLQPINNNPIQPHLSVADRSMPTGLGVSDALFRDYSRVFERNRPQLTVSGLYGNLDTNGDEAVLSGIHNNISYSFGQYHLASDGFRDNADLNHDIYNAFVQAAVRENLNLQFEFLNRETQQGDLSQRLNSENSSSNGRFTLKQNKFRGGIHYKPVSSVDVVATVANQSNDFNDKSLDSDGFGKNTFYDLPVWTGDVQLLWKTNDVSFILGGSAYSRSDNTKTFDISPFQKDTQVTDKEIEGNTFYAYSYIDLPLNVLATLGVSRSEFTERGSQSQQSFSRWQPKLGLQWSPSQILDLRFAYGDTLKATLFADQTIEPTQIAGFNQLFDDTNGRPSSLFAAAIDFSWPKSIYSGFQFSRRDIDNVDFIGGESAQLTPNRQADSYKAYLYWMLGSNFSLSTEYTIEKDSLYRHRLRSLSTDKIPVALRYFNSRGLFAQIGMTYVAQRQTEFDNVDTTGAFVLADMAIGYRLPKRLGLVSLEMRNVFDQKFNYEDKGRFEQADPFNMSRQQEFTPTRTVLARVLFNF